MKRIIPYLLPFILLLVHPAYPDSKEMEAAKEAISDAEMLDKDLNAKKDLRPFIPVELYSQSQADLASAKIYINDGRYAGARYYGTAAVIRIKTAALLARAGLARDQKEKIVSKHTRAAPDTNALIDGNFLKKGDVYRTTIFDHQLFVSKKGHIFYRLAASGKKRLEKVIGVLRAYPGCTLKIVGHARAYDYNNYTKRKAEVVAKYMYNNEISADRIDIVGMGDMEVTGTYHGYRKIDRVEFIVSGIK
ncbi:MAG: hypothetical protein JW807_12910 [Spirochaetes bacterium]|nr:hypothetical protein [Spirochaetota bacterium]